MVFRAHNLLHSSLTCLLKRWGGCFDVNNVQQEKADGFSNSLQGRVMTGEELGLLVKTFKTGKLQKMSAQWNKYHLYARIGQPRVQFGPHLYFEREKNRKN